MSAYCRFGAFGFIGLTAVVLAPAPASAACGFFETLFGQCRQAAPVAAPPPSDAPTPRAAAAARKHVVTRSAEELKQHTLAPPPGVRVGSLAHFSEDRTLRRGDVVVTPDGFRVFTGRSDDHGPQDFAPLGSKKSELINLERVSRARSAGWTGAATLPAAHADAGAGTQKSAN
ncbi:MAG: hypothetical protein KGM42_17990 [Hyphomicrobiales bacterium]|nr:hypothetical protein [Hyphomicrobiales bacterium]